MKISEIFGLNKTQFELDFVDVNISFDTRLFIDPEIIAKSADSFIRLMDCNIKSFFNYFLNLVRQGKKTDAKELFLHLGEVNDICLGMSSAKPKGSGIGKIKAAKIFDSLIESRAVETGVMQDIEDCKLFVDGVDKDNISDMIANIIKMQLIEYTQEQCKLFGIPLQSAPTGWYWNGVDLCWENGYTERLVINNKLYLLVPKRIVTYSSRYSSGMFVQHNALNFMQNEELKLNGPLVQRSYDKKGRLRRVFVTKKSLRHRESAEDEILNKEWIGRFCQNHIEVLKNFKSAKVKSEVFTDFGDVDISELIDYLISQLSATDKGTEHATAFHRLAYGILELLFYPYLCYPRIEKEINDGRKRIDITFNNCAEEGFFNLLSTVHRIPCSLIMVECKNYSHDVANPEVDQLAGRFSVNRGAFGLLVCREVENEQLLLKRCKDLFGAKKELIFYVTDRLLIELLQGYKEEGSQVWERKFQEMLTEIIA